MEGLIPEHRIKSGSINFQNGQSLKFILGLVFNVNGSYYLELHFDESINLDLFHRQNEELFALESEVISTTTEGYEFKATRVSLKRFPFHKSMGDFYCFGSIQLKEIPKIPIPEGMKDYSDDLHFVILEGLKIEFDSHSKYQEDDFGKNNKFHFAKEGLWDFTTVIFQLEDLIPYEFILYRKNESHIVAEFQSHSQLSYSKWEEIKLDFIEFLSFLNGAFVLVREEHYGYLYSPADLTAEVSIYYSRETNTPRRYNNFMAINDKWYRNEHILQSAFMDNFRIYREQNHEWDLNTIIFYLNNAEQMQSIGDRIFIQTILLEKLSSSFAESVEEEFISIIPQDVFNELQKDLIEVLAKYQNKIEKSKYNTIKGRIIEINKPKRGANNIKFKNLIEGVGIEVSERIEKLLIKRNKIVHNGEIGEFDEAYNDFVLMDRLLRRIILNIIGYKGATIEDGKHYSNPPEPLIKNKQIS